MGTRHLYPSLDRETDVIEYARAAGLAGATGLLSSAYPAVFAGGSRYFANSRYFTVPADQSHQIGTSDFMFFCALTRPGSGRMIIWEQYEDANNYVRFEIASDNRAHFIAVIAGVTVCRVTALASYGNVYNISMGISLDRDNLANCKAWLNGLDLTSGTAGEVVTSTSSITTGATSMTIGGSPNVGNYFTGGLQSLCFAKPADVSTVAAEAAAAMYNYMRFRSYAALTPSQIARWGVTAFYDCDETSASANLVDQHGGVNGTPSGDVSAYLPLVVRMLPEYVYHPYICGMLNNYSDNAFLSSWRPDVPTVPYLADSTSLALLGSDSQYVGISGYFLLPFLTSDFTYACWVKTTDASKAIIYKKFSENTKGYSLEVDASGYLLFTLNTTTATGSHVINDGNWHHVAVTADRDGVASLYVDGVLSGTPVALGGQSIESNSAGVRIGNDSYANTYLTGSITDIRAYSYVLSAAQVAALASGVKTNPSWPPNPDAAWWKCEGRVLPPSYGGGPLVCGYAYNADGIGTRAMMMQTVASQRPVYLVPGIGRSAAIELDGTDDYLISVGSTGLDFLSSTTGLLDAVVTPGAIGSEMTIAAVSDTTRDDMYIQFGIDATGKAFIEANDGGVVDRVTGDTVVSASTPYRFRFFSTGSEWVIEVGTTAQTLTVSGTNSGKWFGSLAGLSSWSVGALVTLSGAADYLAGKVGEVVICRSLPGPRTRESMSRVSVYKYGLSS